MSRQAASRAPAARPRPRTSHPHTSCAPYHSSSKAARTGRTQNSPRAGNLARPAKRRRRARDRDGACRPLWDVSDLIGRLCMPEPEDHRSHFGRQIGGSRRSATSAPPRARRACRCVRHARIWPGALATTQRNNDQFRRLWKRSSDGGTADHNGRDCPARWQWWSYWPRGCTTMAGHRRLGRCVACRCQLLVLAGHETGRGLPGRWQAHRFCLGAAGTDRTVRWHE